MTVIMATTPPPLPPRQDADTRPPLPPRNPPRQQQQQDEEEAAQRQKDSLHCASDSTLSIPSASRTSKRRLLLVYVHGFNGSEASFQQFPAHVHSVLAGVVAESHELFTRVYPRYKSRGDMNIARDQFSSWLSPHEAPDLDIILLGHSLGGILTAEVSLLKDTRDGTDGQKHRILGLINYDVPFLGLHPGIIQTSAKSLFHRDQTPAEFDQAFSETQMQAQAQAQAVATLQETSPEHFDPPFFNDVRVPERKGWHGAMHFVEKNYSRLTRSLVSRMVSPYQFAGCLNNYPELRRRYKLLMDLEGAHDRFDRLRFVNYYTDSMPALDDTSEDTSEDTSTKTEKAEAGKDTEKTETDTEKTETDTEKDTQAKTEENTEAEKATEKTEVDTETDTQVKEENTEEKPEKAEETELGKDTEVNAEEKPQRPEKHTTRESADAADANANIDPEPEMAKEQTEADTEKAQSEAKDQIGQTEEDTDKGQTCQTGQTGQTGQAGQTDKAAEKPQKRRKFILLPSHHWRGYADDSLWIPITMENMNEILAHQSIFIPQGRNYEQLVGDTVATIERWVQDSLTAQTLDAVRREEGK